MQSPNSWNLIMKNKALLLGIIFPLITSYALSMQREESSNSTQDSQNQSESGNIVHYSRKRTAEILQEITIEDLCDACIDGNKQAASSIIERQPFKQDEVNSKGYTALHCAASRDGNWEIMLMLIDRMICSVNAQHPQTGRTALHCAIFCKAFFNIYYLIVKCADVDMPDWTGKNALHYTASENLMGLMAPTHEDIWHTLISRSKTKLNALDQTSRKPLSYVIENGNSMLLGALLRYGAIVQLRNPYYRGDLQAAKNRGFFIYQQVGQALLNDVHTAFLQKLAHTPCTRCKEHFQITPETLENDIIEESPNAFMHVSCYHTAQAEFESAQEPTLSHNFAPEDPSILFFNASNTI